MGKYYLSSNTDDSEYESDGGHHYRPLQLGKYKLELVSESPYSNDYLMIGTIYIKLSESGINCTTKDHHGKRHDIFFDYSSIDKNDKLRQAFVNKTPVNISIYGPAIILKLTQLGILRKGAIGQGAYSSARRFISSSDSMTSARSKVILEPCCVPINHADSIDFNNKYLFFNSEYKQYKPEAFRYYDTYRLVVPEITGTLYENIKKDASPIAQTKLFLATVEALKKFHRKGLIYIDLKADNILYESPKTNDPYDFGRSRLIDGGLVSKVGTLFANTSFLCHSVSRVILNQQQYNHIAPECWFTNHNKVYTRHTMDVYSLGMLMKRCLKNPAAPLDSLIQRCCQKYYRDRPQTLKIIEKSLLTYLGEISEQSHNSRFQI